MKEDDCPGLRWGVDDFGGLAARRSMGDLRGATVIDEARCARARSRHLRAASRDAVRRSRREHWATLRAWHRFCGPIFAMDVPAGEPSPIGGTADIAPSSLPSGRRTVMLELDAEGRVVARLHGSASEVLGYDDDEIIGRHFRVLYGPESVTDYEPEGDLAACIASGGLEALGWRVRADGAAFRAWSALLPMYSVDGSGVGGFRLIITDKSFADADDGDAPSAVALPVLDERVFGQELIDRLFRIGLSLEVARGLADDPNVVGLVTEAMNGLDDMVHDVRSWVWERRPGSPL